MKFEIPKEELLRKLTVASKFSLSRISSNSSLQGVLIKTSENSLEITSTNLMEHFYTNIKIIGGDKHSFVIDAKKVIEFLNFLAPGKIILEVEDKKIVIKKDKTEGTFNTISAVDFPETPTLEGEFFLIDKKTIKDSLPLVLFSTAKDESRPVLTGINWANKNDKNYLVSTDGFRLSLLENSLKNNFQGSVSASVLNESIGLVEGEENIKVTYSNKDKKTMIEVGEYKIYSQLIEGDFPPFEKVIPDGYKTRIVVDREEFLRNVKLNAIFARDFSNIIILEIKKDGFYIKPKIKEEGSMITSQEVEFEGEEQKIAFNYKFVIDILNILKTKKVIFEMSSKNAPGVFKMENNDKYTHIIMPVRTDDEE
jgi:DNA polymerase-3 subunit beta